MKNKFRLDAFGVELLVSHNLTPAEINIVKQIHDHKTNKAIAEAIFVTEKTVKYHLTHIYKKMKIKTRFELIVLMSKYFVEMQKEKEVETVPSPKKVPYVAKPLDPADIHFKLPKGFGQ